MAETVLERTAAQIAELAPWPTLPTGARWVRANMVMTLDGNCIGPTGMSRAISSTEDRELLVALRRDADAILIGAGNARIEGYRRPHVPLAIVSGSLRGLAHIPALSDDTTFDRPRPIVITTAAADATLREALAEIADIVIAGEQRVDLRRALDALAARGLHRIQCEGGPHLLGQLITDHLLDELFTTVSPMLVGGPASEHLMDVAGGHPVLGHLVSAHTCNGSLFLRTRLRQTEDLLGD